MCIVLDEKSNHLFHRSRILVIEILEDTATNMSAEPPEDLHDDSFAHFVLKPEPFMEHMPEEDRVQLKAQAAWDTDNHETVSIL